MLLDYPLARKVITPVIISPDYVTHIMTEYQSVSLYVTYLCCQGDPS